MDHRPKRNIKKPKRFKTTDSEVDVKSDKNVKKRKLMDDIYKDIAHKLKAITSDNESDDSEITSHDDDKSDAENSCDSESKSRTKCILKQNCDDNIEKYDKGYHSSRNNYSTEIDKNSSESPRTNETIQQDKNDVDSLSIEDKYVRNDTVDTNFKGKEVPINFSKHLIKQHVKIVKEPKQTDSQDEFPQTLMNFLQAQFRNIEYKFKLLDNNLRRHEEKLNSIDQKVMKCQRRNKLPFKPTFIPVSTEQEFHQLESLNEEQTDNLVSYYIYLGGQNTKDHMSQIIKETFVGSFVINITWFGLGNTLPLHNKQLIKSFYEALVSSGRQITREELQDVTSEALLNSKQRHRNTINRQSSGSKSKNSRKLMNSKVDEILSQVRHEAKE